MSRCVLVVALAGVLAACAPGPTSGAADDRPDRAVVAAVIDGDTVELRIGDGHEVVRLLGIDTPETNHPTRPVECHGAEATEQLTALIPPGTEVRVERDVEARDQYGRLLLYLHRLDDDLFVNHQMVLDGHAVTLHIEPNGVHQGLLAAAEASARAAGVGLWGSCGGPGVALDPLSGAAVGSATG